MTNQEALQIKEKYLANYKDNGNRGKAFEIDIKLYLHNHINGKTAVSKAGKIDTTKKKQKIEIKSGCGEITDILKNDLVIYSPDAMLENAKVYTSLQFMEILESCGLVRDKKTSKGNWIKAIQSFKNSQKKNALFRTLLNNNGMSLQEFKEQH